MSKPRDALELSVAADLTGGSLQHAIDVMLETKYYLKSRGDGWDVLTIASQNMGESIVLRMHHQFTIDLDCGYTPAEWSLTRRYMSADTPFEFKEITVWSPGA